MAGRYNTWIRQSLIDRLKVHGYHGNRKWYALSYTVLFYDSIDTAEEASEFLIERGHFINETDLAIRFPDFESEFYAIAGPDMYRHAQESLIDGLTDDEGYRTWSPETARKYGFDYTGDGADRPFEVEFRTLGRGGKHVVVVEFDGVSLDADLAECIAGEDWENTGSVSNQWCRKLMGMMDEWDVMLTTANAHECGKYYMTDYIARELGLFD
jgi:hypothetical protein